MGRGGGVRYESTHGLLSFISSESPRRAETTHACLLADVSCWCGMLVHADLEVNRRRVPRHVEHCIDARTALFRDTLLRR